VEVFIVVPVESAGARADVGFIVDASVPAVAAERVEGD
jgi:hypothetical protein